MRSCCNDGKFLALSTITLHPSPICLFAVTLKRVGRGREVTVGMERKRRHRPGVQQVWGHLPIAPWFLD